MLRGWRERRAGPTQTQLRSRSFPRHGARPASRVSRGRSHFQPCAAAHRPGSSRRFPNLSIQLPPLGARVPCPASTRCRGAYLLILRTSRDPRRAGRVQSGAQLVQAPLPARLQLRSVSVKDGRWGLGAAQRRHFKLRESEWKIIEENATRC